jgi:carbonic anhydrase
MHRSVDRWAVKALNMGLMLVLCFPLRCLVAQESHRTHTAWDYGNARGPSHWGDLDPAFETCKNGHSQSPVDIQKAQKADLPLIQFKYQRSPLHIVDNGHTIMINYAAGSFILVGDQRYELKQFHFHHPSEESIHGEVYPMEAHLVHVDAKGNLAVVAIILKEGGRNTAIEALWNNLPKQKAKEESHDIWINATDLLPDDRGYYTFSGSLTTPPCTENVTWFVLKKLVGVSTEEIQRFASIYRNDVRPTQPLHGRRVLESKQ